MIHVRRCKATSGRLIARCYLLLLLVVPPALLQAQEATFSIQFQRVPLEQALDRLRTVTGASIAFNRSDLAGVEVGPVAYKGQSAEQILKGLLKQRPFTVEKMGGAFVIKRIAPPPPASNAPKLKDTGMLADIDSTKGSGLNEVVVLGFGQSQKKIAQTGAVVSIGTKEIKQSPVSNIANALAGRLPGLIAVQRSGEPGADVPELYIRGIATMNSAAPLITIDGVQKEAKAISLLDPNEVESITILKDASATALYGVKGANGVIIIKTRRGKEGAPTANASLQTSVQKAKRPGK
jgi:TonB-dependent SusC/RagA subfamily outer membrane receptor